VDFLPQITNVPAYTIAQRKLLRMVQNSFDAKSELRNLCTAPLPYKMSLLAENKNKKTIADDSQNATVFSCKYFPLDRMVLFQL
jgi:hypothetical protein